MRSESPKRIGTWNLDGKWSSEHRSILFAQRCDVWLLTEVSTEILDDDLVTSEYHIHHTSKLMLQGKYWSAILTAGELTPLPDPHPASAAALIDGIVYCSSILPWGTCGSEPDEPWTGSNLEEKTKTVTEQIEKSLQGKRAVWGGDWNQNLSGGWEHVGSQGMRNNINSVLNSLGLIAATRELPHRIKGSHTIDHIAVPSGWTNVTAEHISALGLSDHDLYLIEVPKT